MGLFLPAFFVAGISTAIVLFVFMRLSGRRTFFRLPQAERHKANPHAARVGGIAMCFCFLLALLISEVFIIDHKTFIFLAGLSFFVAWGVIDDFREVWWPFQLTVQVGVSALLFLFGLGINEIVISGNVISFDSGYMFFLGLLLSVVWFVGVMNALNWSDGIDGLSGGVTFIAACTLFLIALRPEVYQPPIGIITAALAGTVLAFTIINIAKGTVIAGSSGSAFMGYAIAAIAIFAGAKIGTALLVLIVPIIDALWVIIARYRDGASIFRADTRHLHHRLLERGWDKWQVLFLYYSLTLVGAVLALSTISIGKILTIVGYGGAILVAIGALSYIASQKKYNEEK